MKLRTLIYGLASLILSPSVFAQSIPLDRAEILGRLAVANSPSYIAHLVKIRGESSSPGADFLSRVKLAGGDGILVERLTSADSPRPTFSSIGADSPIDHLAKCAEFIHTGAIESAEKECRASIEENPKSPWPLLVSANLLAGGPLAKISPELDEERKVERVEFLRRAAALGPNLAMTHTLLAPTLPAPNFMSELQAASSLDPERLEGSEIGVWGLRANMFSFTPSEATPEPAIISIDPASMNPELVRRMQIEPELASNHAALAYLYIRGRNYERAEQELRESVRLEPDNPAFHTCLAFFYHSRQDTNAALAELHEAVRIVPFGTLEHLALAGALELLGRTSEAVAELQTTIIMHPGEIRASNVLVELYIEHKDRKSAIGELQRSLQASSLSFSDPAKFVVARFDDLDRLALLLKENHQLDAATEQFLFLLRFKPDDGRIHNDYGNVLLDQHRLDDAIAEYNEAIRLDPTMSSPHHNIGMCLAQKKNLDGAIAEFRQALELNPDEPRTQFFLGTALGQKGDLGAAREQFQQAIEKNPQDAETHMSLAYALEQLKDPAGAMNELKVALELQPDSPSAANNLAWMYATADDLKLRNPREALILARQAVASSPQPEPAYIDTLAEALLLNGHPKEALATEMEAAKLDPENPEFQSRLAHFREAQTEPPPQKP